MNQRRVLVIDDLGNIELMLREGLLFYPVEICFSTGKKDALNRVLKDQPDLLVSGLKFNDGNAVELMNELKQIFSRVPPGIFLAKESEKDIQQEIVKMGAVDILPRPFEMAALHRKIDQTVKAMKTYNAQSPIERFVRKALAVDEFQVLLEESKKLGIPLAELIKLKQVSTE